MVLDHQLATVFSYAIGEYEEPTRDLRPCRGKASLVRFADDFIACFQDEKDAQRFLIELRKRLADFNLEVEPSKTAVIRFGSQTERQCGQKGQGRPQTFNFLGFTHYVTRSHSGRFEVGRKTEGKRIRRKLKEVKVRLMLLRTQSGKAMKDYIKQHLQGHIQYYGVSGNTRSLKVNVQNIGKMLFKWLNRRSQLRSVKWEKYSKWVKTFFPPIRIIHNL